MLPRSVCAAAEGRERRRLVPLLSLVLGLVLTAACRSVADPAPTTDGAQGAGEQAPAARGRIREYRGGVRDPEAEAQAWLGRWDTPYGELELRRDGDLLQGSYPGGSLSGRVEGGRLAFTYREDGASGRGWLELDGERQGFVGQWRPEGSTQWSSWTGARTTPPTGFAGLWHTPFGRLRIRVQGNEASGSYESVPGSRIEGRLVGPGLTKLEGSYSEPGSRGRLSFELTADGQAFRGSWRPQGEGESDVQRPWNGKRVVPQPGLVWLVILEAHWEETLREPEYAFGEMLARYFSMGVARHVRVRQRSFHDRADFQRFASEVAFLAEPAVLVVSTHGTPEGITVAGHTIGPASIAAALEHVSNLRLLHLSGCSMLDGPVPAAIHARLGDAAHFPISGYATDVAWDSSALADFTFLTLLLLRGLPPQLAVSQTHLVAPFTAQAAPEGSSFAPLGLRVLVP